MNYTHTEKRERWTKNLRVVMFSTVTFVPTYNNICTIYDKWKWYDVPIQHRLQPNAITFLNGITKPGYFSYL